MIKNFKKICDRKGISEEANSHFLAMSMVHKCPKNPKIALFQTFKNGTYRPPPWLKNAPLRCASVLYTHLKFQGSGMSSYWDITENNCTPWGHFYLLIVGNREINPYMYIICQIKKKRDLGRWPSPFWPTPKKVISWPEPAL